jgi:hypothetical protein
VQDNQNTGVELSVLHCTLVLSNFDFMQYPNYRASSTTGVSHRDLRASAIFGPHRPKNSRSALEVNTIIGNFTSALSMRLELGALAHGDMSDFAP